VRSRRSKSKAALAAETWHALFDFFMSTRPQRDAILRRHGLTPNDVRAIASLDPREGRSMRSLAEEWACDASNATWIVDRLERTGLAERKPHTTDRRVKLVSLTPLGARTRARMLEEMHHPPPELLDLGTAALRALRDAAVKLPVGRRKTRKGTPRALRD